MSYDQETKWPYAFGVQRAGIEQIIWSLEYAIEFGQPLSVLHIKVLVENLKETRDRAQEVIDSEGSQHEIAG